jgi:hypothetical protein
MKANTLSTFIAERKKVADGTITLTELTKAIAKASAAPVPVTKVPLPAVITQKQTEALERLRTIFGTVVPETSRALTALEVNDLMIERETLDEIEKLAKARKESIRTTVLNHIDVTVEGDQPVDKEGHVLKATRVPAPSQGRDFSWEISTRGGTLDAAGLAQLEADGKLDHETYLSMTDQVRVLNENKVMLALQKNPELVDVLGDAVSTTTQVGSLYVRNLKE